MNAFQRSSEELVGVHSSATLLESLICLARLALIAVAAGCQGAESGVLCDAGDCAELDGAASAFDPRGDALSLYADWDVNGALPSDEGCERAGLDTVELVFIEPGGTAEYTDETFRFPCALEYFETIPDRVLAAGRHAYRWRAYEGDELVLQSQRYEATAGAGSELVLQRVDFQRRAAVVVDIELSWESEVGLATTCAVAGVNAGYSYRLYRGTSVGNGTLVPGYASNGIVACADALRLFEHPPGSLSEGQHILEIEGQATDGSTWSSACALSVPNGGRVETACLVTRGS